MTLYLGIDISKHSFTSAIEIEGLKAKEIMSPYPNKAKGYNQLKQTVIKLTKQYKTDEVHLGVESTGGYEVTLVKWFRAHTDFKITIINPVQVKRFMQSRLIRTKTDPVDARSIASYLAINKPEATAVLPNEIEDLKALSRHLDHLIRKRASEMTYLESVRDSDVKQMVKQTIRSYDRQIEKVEKKITDHLDNHPKLKANQELLKSIPGIGETTSGILLSEINSSLDPKQQVAHAGLAPRERQSGTLRGKPQLCKTGNRRLRRALYLPTLTAIRFNPIIKTFYERLLSKGKPKMVAIGACMRKLLHIVIGVLKNQIPFNPDYHQLRLAS